MTNIKATNCLRAGCGRKLRSNNKRGVCGVGCLSYEAPPSVRVKLVTQPEFQVPNNLDAKSKKKIMADFRIVAEALGKDPDALLLDAAQHWLAAVRAASEKLDNTP